MTTNKKSKRFPRLKKVLSHLYITSEGGRIFIGPKFSLPWPGDTKRKKQKED